MCLNRWACWNPHRAACFEHRLRMPPSVSAPLSPMKTFSDSTLGMESEEDSNVFLVGKEVTILSTKRLNKK